MSRFSERAEHDLRAAGWEPGRKVDTAEWRGLLEASGEVRMHAAAEEFLGEFGGLKVPISGPGISVARGGRFFLGISEAGEILLVETWVASFGFGDAALENLILGVKPEKLA